MGTNIWEQDDLYKPQPVSDAVIQMAEAKLKVTLPASYIELLKQQNGGRFIHNAYPAPQHEKFDEPFIEVEYIDGIDEDSSILESEELCEEWEMPKGLVLFHGDGHTWLAFDYRHTSANPPIVYVDNHEETSQVFEIAKSFDEFLENLYTVEIELDDEESSPVTYSKEEFEALIEEDDVDSLYDILMNDHVDVEADDDWYIEKLLHLSTHPDEYIRTGVANCILNRYTSVLDDERLNQFISIFKADKKSDVRDYADWIVGKMNFSLEYLKSEMDMYDNDYGYEVISRFTHKGNNHHIQIESKLVLVSEDGTKQQFNSIEEFFKEAKLDGIPLAEAWDDVKKR